MSEATFDNPLYRLFRAMAGVAARADDFPTWRRGMANAYRVAHNLLRTDPVTDQDLVDWLAERELVA